MASGRSSNSNFGQLSGGFNKRKIAVVARREIDASAASVNWDDAEADILDLQSRVVDLEFKTQNVDVDEAVDTTFVNNINLGNTSFVEFSNGSTIGAQATNLAITVAGAGSLTTGPISCTQLKASGLIGTGNTNTTGYFLPDARPLLGKYVLLTPTPPGNTLAFSNVVSNMTAAPLSTSFAGTVSTTGPITIVNGASSYSFPLVGPTELGSTLTPVNTGGTLTWARPSFLRAYRLDATSQPATHTFTSAFNSPLNVLQFMPTTAILGDFVWPGDGTVKYVGAVQRTFQASCSVYLSGESKNLNQFSTMIMRNLTDNKVLATKSFNIEEDLVMEHCLHGVGSVSTNDLIVVSLTVNANATIRSGSPNFSIIIN